MYKKKLFKKYHLYIRPNLVFENQEAANMFVYRMSSGVPVPSLSQKFSKLEDWWPFQGLDRSCKNKTPE